MVRNTTRSVQCHFVQIYNCARIERMTSLRDFIMKRRGLRPCKINGWSKLESTTTKRTLPWRVTDSCHTRWVYLQAFLRLRVQSVSIFYARSRSESTAFFTALFKKQNHCAVGSTVRRSVWALRRIQTTGDTCDKIDLDCSAT